MGYNYIISDKLGKTNKATDVVSWQDHPESKLFILSTPFGFLSALLAETNTLSDLQDTHKEVQQANNQHSTFKKISGILYCRGNPLLGKFLSLKSFLLQEFHEMPTGGHAGVAKTFKSDKCSVYWHGMRTDVKEIVSTCQLCQESKYES